jgi:putative heme-binding domain-containing protein
VRAVQLALGDLTAPALRGTVFEGYSLRRDPGAPQPALLAALRAAFPSGHPDLDRELSRTLAALQDDDGQTLEKVTGSLTDAAPPLEDLHYLIVLARLRAPRTPAVTTRVAHALLALDRKFADRRANRDRYWPLRVSELHAELARQDPALGAAILSDPQFGRPDHALFALAPRFDRPRAAAVILERAQAQGIEEYPWSPTLIELLGSLPPERSFPVLRALWDHVGLDDAILGVLARHPEAVDRPRFLEGLGSSQWATVRLALDALKALPGGQGETDDLLVALVRALRRIPDGKEGAGMRERVARALQQATDRKSVGSERADWETWLARSRPDLAARLKGDAAGVDLAQWRERLARLDWSAGSSERGNHVFIKSGCAVCHSGGQALGPDLRGVAGRFSRDDLYTAILQPGRDVSARYRTDLVAMADGQVYQGMVVYEAVDGLILQTGATTTIRLAGDQIASRRDAPGSLMPTGLIDKLSDHEITDLYAYLKSLGAGEEGRR